MKINHILESEEKFTVATSYTPMYFPNKNHFEDENELEMNLINELQAGQYEYANIKTEEELIKNLKNQIENLNDIKFSPNDWERFLQKLTNPQLTDENKINMLQKSEVINFTLEDEDVSRNIYLIKKDCYSKNHFQVINQYENGKHRYDVVILINGLPLVLIELKRRGGDLYSAFEQVSNYKKFFSSGKALFQFVHMFIISNGTFTKYFSPSIAKEKNTNKKNNNTYGQKFWINWADQKNNKIDELMDFAKLFLWKNKLFNILFKYCVLAESGTANWNLKIMRPYQIAAAELIINKINISKSAKKHPKDSGGFIWHSTGSGKTLTAFKTVSLVKDLDFVKKVLLVVDRKDLDAQTQKRFNEFEEGSALKTDNTSILKSNLESENPNKKVIITTIQKLSKLLKDPTSKNLNVFNQEVVIIFDECHRSQFGTMHKAITKSFKKHYIFGFTGTPIFSENHAKINKTTLQLDSSNETTTQELFGDLLHSYTMKDAINDNNVLKFQHRSYRTWIPKEIISEKDKEMSSDQVNKKEIKLHNERISKIVSKVIEEFDSVTARKQFFSNESKEKNKLNGLFVAESVESAQKYYNEFKKQIKEKNLDQKLKVAIIFSCSPNADNLDNDDIDENDYNTDKLSSDNHTFLKNAINDYYKMIRNTTSNENSQFHTINNLDNEKFSNYYKQLSKSIENVEVDLVIVVNMLLTGFDSVRLGALWVDKKLKMHNLIQSFSRTNRIYNNEKKTGQIITFVDLEQEIKDAFSIFARSSSNTNGYTDIVILDGYQDYWNKYDKITDDLKNQFPIAESKWKHTNDVNVIKKFVQIFNKFLELHTTLNRFSNFKNDEKISYQEFQDYQSCYKNFSRKTKEEKTDKPSTISIINDIDFQLEFLREYQMDDILDIINSYKESKIKKYSFPKFMDNLRKDLENSDKLKPKKEVILEIFEEMNGKNIESNFEKEYSEIAQKKLDENIQNSIKLLKFEKNININDMKFKQILISSIENHKIIYYGSDFESVIESDWSKDSREEPTKQVIAEIEKIYHKFSDIYAI